MSLLEQNYSVDNQEMLAIVMSCHRWRHYLKGTRRKVEVLTDYRNLLRFITTKSLLGWQARWWRTILSFHLNVVYRAGKKNPANDPNHWPDYVKAPEGLCTATVLTARYNMTFCLWQLYAAAIQAYQIFEDVPSNSLLNLICKGLAE
jgi:hypothetical protein